MTVRDEHKTDRQLIRFRSALTWGGTADMATIGLLAGFTLTLGGFLAWGLLDGLHWLLAAAL